MERTDEESQRSGGRDEDLLEDIPSRETAPIDLQCSDGEALQRYEG